jgi:tRNA (guanine9-N1)-methyltransferase
MHVSSLNKRLLARYEGVLQNQHKKWKGMTFSSEPYPVTTDEEKANLVYLTADSPNTITSLDPGKTYIIGGIVDRNRYKRLCLDKANEQGIAHAKLPIGDYIKMASRQVLTTNQVVEIMLEWLKEKDWEKAFIKVIPQRKMPQLKKKGEENEGLDGNDGQDQEDNHGAESEHEPENEMKEDKEAEEQKEITGEHKMEGEMEGENKAEPHKMDVDSSELKKGEHLPSP